MNIDEIALKEITELDPISRSAVFFVMDNECRILSMSERAKEFLRISDVSLLKGLHCSVIIEKLPCCDCPPKSFGIIRGALKTFKGREDGTFIYYPLKDEKGEMVGSVWNFIKQNIDRSTEEAFWVSKNKTMSTTVQRALIAAKSSVPITIFGETGTGKTELARFIHQHSEFREGPFIHINCSTIPETLFESELFGYEKGAFTDASTQKNGYIAMADRGTLFLDEIADLPLSCQSKLLTFLDTKRYRPLGATRERTAHVRIISSSNKPLWQMTKTGEFRLDLFYRISVVRLFVPPLRERKEDIPALVNRFLNGRKRLSPRAMELILSRPWHGNIRELFSVLESACICSADEETILPEHLCFEYEDEGGKNPSQPPVRKMVKRPLKREEILKALADSSNNRVRAASILGISRMTLWRMMKRYGIEEEIVNRGCSCLDGQIDGQEM